MGKVCTDEKECLWFPVRGLTDGESKGPDL